MPVYLVFKELWRNKGRFFLVSLVIALITTLVLFIAALAEGLGSGNIQYIKKLNADLVLYQADSDLSISAGRIGRSRLNDIRRIDGVQAVGPIGFSAVSIIAPGTAEPLDVSLIGVEPGKPGDVPALDGRGLKVSRAKEAVIDEYVVAGTGLSVGDTFLLKTVQGTEEKFFEFTVAGITDGRQYFIQPGVIIPYLTWNDVRPKGNVEDPNAELFSNIVGVQLDNPQATKPMKANIEALLSDIEAVDKVTAYTATPGYTAQQSTLNTQRGFTLLIGILVIGGFFQIQTLQKVPQIGMLKAIGSSNFVIAAATIIQIALVSIIGVAIGTGGTLALTLFLPPVIPIIFTPNAIIAAVVTLLIIGPLGGLVSVKAALDVEPLTALGLSN